VSDIGTPPEGIGPHEDRELELMLIGEKPLAMFGDAVSSDYEVPEADFAPYVSDGTFVRREMVYLPPEPEPAIRTVYFARAGEEWRIEAMHRIKQRLFVYKEPISLETEREIGRLLGYADSDINSYLEWIGLKGSSHI
jgi:hypothetical protein